MPSLYHVTLSCTRMGKIHSPPPLTLDLTMWPASAVETLAGIILKVLVWYNWVLTALGPAMREACPQGTAAPSTWASRQIYMEKITGPKNIVELSIAESQPEEPLSQPLPNYRWPADSLCMNKHVLLQTTVLQKHLYATLLQQLTSKLLFISSLRWGNVMIIAISPVPH